jgi:hypothetical protein
MSLRARSQTELKTPRAMTSRSTRENQISTRRFYRGSLLSNWIERGISWTAYEKKQGIALAISLQGRGQNSSEPFDKIWMQDNTRSAPNWQD